MFYFEYVSSECSVSVWARIWGSVVIFRSQRGPRAKEFGKHWLIWMEKQWVNALAVRAVQGWLTCWNVMLLGVQYNVTALHMIVKLQHATSTRHI